MAASRQYLSPRHRDRGPIGAGRSGARRKGGREGPISQEMHARARKSSRVELISARRSLPAPGNLREGRTRGRGTKLGVIASLSRDDDRDLHHVPRV